MRRLFDDVKIMAGLLALLWLILIFDLTIDHGALFLDGIVPRTVRGLIGIPLAPLLHAGPAHLIANSGPFFVLGLMVLRQGRQAFVTASLFIIFVGGFATWCIGPANTVHGGASALIFGWFGFLVVSAWRQPQPATVLAAAIAVAWYGAGVLFGLSPLQYGVSWQGHLTGLLAGGLAAYYAFPSVPIRRRSRRRS
jgi:membrane associated rhomboid family serine protease